MAIELRTPGVYREEVFLRAPEALPTGIPGFVGFAREVSSGAMPANVPVLFNRSEEFTERVSEPPAQPGVRGFYLADAVSGFFANAGKRCYVVRLEPSRVDDAALIGGIEKLAAVTDLDLVAVPDATGLLEADAVRRVQRALLEHCSTEANRFALLDAPAGIGPDEVVQERRLLLTGVRKPEDGALYYPWVRTGKGRLVPPCGHVAGVFGRSDAAVGVFKAPANEELADVRDVETLIDHAQQGSLNPEGVNCLRVFPGRGIRVWGARTLSPDPVWRYINVRRLFITTGRWIEGNMAWAAFEPNSPRLWVRIQRELTVYLRDLWRQGALKGASAEEAFFVKCDVETNPGGQRELGEVVTELGLAPLLPAEFVRVRIVHRSSGVEFG
jgi:hypothetical protein